MPKPKKAEKEPIDEFTPMGLEDLKKFVEEQQKKLSDVKNRRNFVQQEREMINNYYNISKTEQKKIDDQIKVVEFDMDELSKNHTKDLEAFTNKFKHLEYDHETFITRTLNENSQKAVSEEEVIRKEREDEYLKRKQKLKSDIKDKANDNRENIEKKKKNIETQYDTKMKNLEAKLKKIRQK